MPTNDLTSVVDPFSLAFSQRVFDELDKRKRTRIFPWKIGQLADLTGINRSKLSRLINIEERARDRETFERDGHKRGTSESIFPVARVLSISLDEIRTSVFLAREPAASVDFGYIRNQGKRSRFQPDWMTWEVQLEEIYRKKGLPVRIVVVPTNEKTRASNEEKLSLLGQVGAQVLYDHIFKGCSRTILCGLGKHVDALIHAVPNFPSKQNDLQWLPAMPTYQGLDHFSANNLCSAAAHKLGGNRPIELAATGYVEVGQEDAVDYFLQEPSHVSLIGYPGQQREDLPNRGLAHGADSAVLGCGMAAPGNPLWESPKRLSNPWQLRSGNWQSPGDANGHYLLLRGDGQPQLVPENAAVPSEDNQEARDANFRALGARPSLIKGVAERCRRESREGGVILLANTEGRASLAYAAVEAGLVNTLVMDYECARTFVELVQLVEDKQSIFAAFPERHFF